MSTPLQYLEELRASTPEHSVAITELGNLYERKLWHQVTLSLEALIVQPAFAKGTALIDCYHKFISDFAHKLNYLKLAHIAVTVSKQYEDEEAAVQFLQQVIESQEELKVVKTAESLLYLRMTVAQYKLQQDLIADARKMLDEGEETLKNLTEVDPSSSAAVHYVNSLYHKQQADFAAFFKSSLLYLCFVSSDSLPPDFQLSLAVDISLAAMLGEGVYSFGELLLHPIVKVLDRNSEYTWLREMLECFNHGDMHLYDTLCQKYAGALNAQPALVAHERALREKITILCLMELIFTLPPEERTIPLQDIGTRTKLDTDGVEFLLMKTLALKLIEGVIDQVEGTVQVCWVQPRVLTFPQIEGLKGRLESWTAKVGDAKTLLLEQGVGELSTY